MSLADRLTGGWLVVKLTNDHHAFAQGADQTTRPTVIWSKPYVGLLLNGHAPGSS